MAGVGAGQEEGGEASEGGPERLAPSFSQHNLGGWLDGGQWTGSKPEGTVQELEAIRKGEAQQIPWSKVLILLVMFAGEFMLLHSVCSCVHVYRGQKDQGQAFMRRSG